jgi:hypothetical protein
MEYLKYYFATYYLLTRLIIDDKIVFQFLISQFYNQYQSRQQGSSCVDMNQQHDHYPQKSYNNSPGSLCISNIFMKDGQHMTVPILNILYTAPHSAPQAIFSRANHCHGQLIDMT